MGRERKPRGAGAPRLQDTVRLSADGLAKVMGDLEARVLRAAWTLGAPAPARAIYEVVAADLPVAPITVITVSSRRCTASSSVLLLAGLAHAAWDRVRDSRAPHRVLSAIDAAPPDTRGHHRPRTGPLPSTSRSSSHAL